MPERDGGSSRRGGPTMPYLAVKLDVVRSRRVRRRSALQDALFSLCDRVNRLYANVITSAFTVTHGDEIQGMLPAREVAVCLAACEALHRRAGAARGSPFPGAPGKQELAKKQFLHAATGRVLNLERSTLVT